MTRGVYTLVLRLLAPLVWLWMARRARRIGGGWGILSAPRFGRYAKGGGPVFAGRSPVWVHAVSLGETRAAQPLVQALLDKGLPVLMTHTTATGREEGGRLFAAAIAAGQLVQTWLPYDFPGATRGFLRHYAPRCGVLIEREIWPNLLAAARWQGVPMALVSARFSESSLRQAKWFGPVMRQALESLTWVLAQTPADAQRLRQAGARAPQVTGNLKFDLSLSDAQLQAGQTWKTGLDRPVIALASTREGEEALFIQAIREHADDALYVLIPRHPQRFDPVAALLQEAGLGFERRSNMPQHLSERTTVLLGDTLGEMPFYYAAAEVAIVAGSFAPFGGHNLIEACAAGVPVIVGPHTFNFQQAVSDAIEAGAALRASDTGEALAQALALLKDTSRRSAMKQAAHAWTASHKGATNRTLSALAGCLDA